jgi:hypothetical protein
MKSSRDGKDCFEIGFTVEIRRIDDTDTAFFIGGGKEQTVRRYFTVSFEQNEIANLDKGCIYTHIDILTRDTETERKFKM